MTGAFRFSRLPLIIFGNGKFRELPGLIKRYGRKVMLLTGNSFPDSSHASVFKDPGITGQMSINRFTISCEPSDDIIDRYVTTRRDDPPDVIVSIGGGSVMDAGKAISAMITVRGNIKDYLEGVGFKDHPGTKIPFIAVPTTAGTGSEVTKNAVISGVGENGFKKSLRHDNFVPDIALVDPDLTKTCPPDITASSGMDSFTQLTEAYLSTGANEYTDALAVEGLKAIKSSLIRAFRDGNDIEARTGMAFAALTSGICLANAGLGVVHGFASSIGGLYEVHHGVVCGTLMAVSNELTVKRVREKSDNQKTLKKYATLARLFLDDKPGKSDNMLIDEFIGYLHQLTEDLKLPLLKEAGIKEESLEKIALLTESKNNPVPLETADLLEILNRRFT